MKSKKEQKTKTQPKNGKKAAVESSPLKIEKPETEPKRTIKQVVIEAITENNVITNDEGKNSKFPRCAFSHANRGFLMTPNTTQSVLFPELFSKPILATFDQPDSSSDGGAILLKAIDTELGLTERLAGCIHDERESGKIVHQLFDLFRQRVYGIACGWRTTLKYSMLHPQDMIPSVAAKVCLFLSE